MSLALREGGKAYGYRRETLVGHDEVCGQRINAALHALHGSVKGLEIDGDIG